MEIFGENLSTPSQVLRHTELHFGGRMGIDKELPLKHLTV